AATNQEIAAMISPLLVMTTGRLRLMADLLIGCGLVWYLLHTQKVHARTRAEAGRVRLLLDSTFEGIIGLDLDGSCTSCNRACLQHLGYESADQLLGKKLHEICHSVPTGGSPQPNTDCAGAYKCIRTGETSYMDDELFLARRRHFSPGGILALSHVGEEESRRFGPHFSG